MFFWRTYDQQEIDLVEETSGKLNAFEFKWGNKTPKVPQAFGQSYPSSAYHIINPENYLEFI